MHTKEQVSPKEQSHQAEDTSQEGHPTGWGS
jgi:hypothetical protein